MEHEEYLSVWLRSGDAIPIVDTLEVRLAIEHAMDGKLHDMCIQLPHVDGSKCVVRPSAIDFYSPSTPASRAKLREFNAMKDREDAIG